MMVLILHRESVRRKNAKKSINSYILNNEGAERSKYQ